MRMPAANLAIETAPFKSMDQRKKEERIHVLLVDDHQIMREGLRLSLRQEPDIEVVGEAEDGHTAMTQVERLRPHVIVMDVGLPDTDGVTLSLEILVRWPTIRIVILSASLDRQQFDEAVKAGVAGYILKVNASSELVRAIRTVMRNESYACREVSAMALGGYRELLVAGQGKTPSALSDREAEVLKLIADGWNTKEIAGKLSLSVKTVESHRMRIMARLDLHSVAELTKYAVRQGLTSLRRRGYGATGSGLGENPGFRS
jgi:DNA-binding NarL/FixJ family response regulator